MKPLAMKKALFIDRDGTLIQEPPVDFQVDSLNKLAFYPGAIRNLWQIRNTLDFELVMVSNQDGLGTPSFPEEDFWPAHRLMLQTFEGEGVTFDDIIIDRTLPQDNQPTRKPGTALMGKYLDGSYDLGASFVIGDRVTDIQLAHNLGAMGILLGPPSRAAELEIAGLASSCALITPHWDEIFAFLRCGERKATVKRTTSETDISLSIDLDGCGNAKINTGLGFFDHMLEQIARHGGCDLDIQVQGDLGVDEHHTIEDTGIVLGEAIAKALGSKRGIERYGFVLPMDDCLAQVALDFGGRSWLVWDVRFERERVGDVPTELFHHFFKSLSDGARMNLNIKAEGENEHHKAEAIFKAFARAMKAAVRRNAFQYELPTSKGML